MYELILLLGWSIFLSGLIPLWTSPLVIVGGGGVYAPKRVDSSATSNHSESHRLSVAMSVSELVFCQGLPCVLFYHKFFGLQWNKKCATLKSVRKRRDYS